MNSTSQSSLVIMYVLQLLGNHISAVSKPALAYSSTEVVHLIVEKRTNLTLRSTVQFPCKSHKPSSLVPRPAQPKKSRAWERGYKPSTPSPELSAISASRHSSNSVACGGWVGHVLDFSCEGLARETMLDRELDTPTATY